MAGSTVCVVLPSVLSLTNICSDSACATRPFTKTSYDFAVNTLLCMWILLLEDVMNVCNCFLYMYVHVARVEDR